MNIPQAKALFQDTLVKEYRSKTIVFIGIFTILLMVGMNVAVDTISEAIEGQANLDIGDKKIVAFYFVINSWTVIMSCLFGISTMKSDFDQNVVSQILSFPVKRWEYSLVRILGSSSIVITYYILSIILAAVFYGATSGDYKIGLEIFMAIPMTVGIIFAVLTWSAILSLFFNKVLSFIGAMTLFFFVSLSNSSLEMVPLKDLFNGFGFLKVLSLIFYFFFPHTGTLGGMTSDILMGNGVSSNIAFEMAHYPLSMTFAFLVLFWFFRRIDF